MKALQSIRAENGRDGYVGSVHANRSHIRDVSAVRQSAGIHLLPQLFVTLVHERPRRSQLEVGFGDLAMHDLTLVEL